MQAFQSHLWRRSLRPSLKAPVWRRSLELPRRSFSLSLTLSKLPTRSHLAQSSSSALRSVVSQSLLLWPRFRLMTSSIMSSLLSFRALVQAKRRFTTRRRIDVDGPDLFRVEFRPFLFFQLEKMLFARTCLIQGREINIEYRRNNRVQVCAR